MKNIFKRVSLGAVLFLLCGLFAIAGISLLSNMFLVAAIWVVIGPVFEHLAGMNQEIDHSGEAPKPTQSSTGN